MFLTGKPLDLLQEGRFHKVPFIFGITSQEGMLILRGKSTSAMTLNYGFKLRSGLSECMVVKS
jgi:hypothetical protein